MIGKCYETFGLVKYMLVIISAPSLCMSFDIRATHSEESLRQRQACFVSHGLCKVWVNHLSNFSRGGVILPAAVCIGYLSLRILLWILGTLGKWSKYFITEWWLLYEHSINHDKQIKLIHEFTDLWLPLENEIPFYVGFGNKIAFLTLK